MNNLLGHVEEFSEKLNSSNYKIKEEDEIT
jgi:hypothetical protein